MRRRQRIWDLPRAVFGAVVVGVALLILPLAGAATNFVGGFESGSYRPFDGIQYEEDRPLSDSFELVANPVREGRYAAKIIVRQGYSRWGYAEDTELEWESNEGQGDDYYYAFSTLFPTDWVAPYSWGIFLQWHARLGTPPPVSFNARADSAYVHVRGGDTDENAYRFEYDKLVQVLPTLSKGTWNDFVAHIRWSSGSDGLVEVWHRVAGQSGFTKILTLTNIGTLQRTSRGTATNYTLWGLYRGSYCPQPTQLGCTSSMGTQPNNVLYQDGFTRGTSFNDVVAAAFGGSDSGPAPAPTPAPAPVPSSAPQSPPPATSSLAPGPELPLVSGFDAVTDQGCSGCRVTIDGARVDAQIAGGDDRFDTAYGIKDFGGSSGWNGRLYVRDDLGLGRNQTLGANVALLQALDVNKRILFELYVAPDRTLRLWSSPASLGSSAINESTGVTVPTDGSTIRAEVSALKNDSAVVRVNGLDRIVVTGLSGATSGRPRYLLAGIDHYDTASTAETVAATHRNLGISTTGWLGGRTDGGGALQSTQGSSTPATAGGGSPVSGGSSVSGGGSAAAKAGPQSGAGSPKSTVVWEDITFTRAKALRLHLEERGVDWNAFLKSHPSIADAFDIAPVKWEGRTFYSEQALAEWLATRNVSYRRWTATHPGAAEILAKNDAAAGLPTVGRALVWKEKRFPHGAALQAFVEKRGGDWERFLARNPSITRSLDVRPLRWDGATFYTREGFSRWLRVRGQNLREWTAAHPGAVSGLWTPRASS